MIDNIFDNALLCGLIVIFIVFFTVSRALKGKPLEKIINEAGLGSLLAGTFFGVVREVLLDRPANPTLTILIMLLFFMWYILTKGLASLFITGSSKDVVNSNIAGGSDAQVIDKNEQKSIKLNKIFKSDNKLPDLYNVFIAAIITLLVVVLMVSFYAQRKEGSDKHIVNYNIMITCMVFIAGFFTFLSGKKIENEVKIKILAYTAAYAVIFGILVPIFVFKSFTFKSLIISSLIFFVWLTLTNSITNFVTPKPEYIKRS